MHYISSQTKVHVHVYVVYKNFYIFNHTLCFQENIATAENQKGINAVQ